jgi:hypothetical protein
MTNDIGPQRGPSSVRKIEAETKHVRKELESMSDGQGEAAEQIKTSDELRAAAEEIVKHIETIEQYRVPNFCEQNAHRLAQHYLATHRADDGELADAEWWLTFCNNKELGIHYFDTETWLHISQDVNGILFLSIDDSFDPITIAVNPTRGQVRRLVEALGGR